MVATRKCVHVWDIETPNGATSKGVCRNCGEIREFSNILYPDTQGNILWRMDREMTDCRRQYIRAEGLSIWSES